MRLRLPRNRQEQYLPHATDADRPTTARATAKLPAHIAGSGDAGVRGKTGEGIRKRHRVGNLSGHYCAGFVRHVTTVPSRGATRRVVRFCPHLVTPRLRRRARRYMSRIAAIYPVPNPTHRAECIGKGTARQTMTCGTRMPIPLPDEARTARVPNTMPQYARVLPFTMCHTTRHCTLVCTPRYLVERCSCSGVLTFSIAAPRREEAFLPPQISCDGYRWGTFVQTCAFLAQDMRNALYCARPIGYGGVCFQRRSVHR